MAEKSNVSPEWVVDTATKYPPVKLPNGDIRLFGRFAFVNVLERPKPGADGKERAYGLVLMVPEKTDLTLMKNEAKALFQEKAPLALTNKAIAEKYHNPFRKQDEYVDKNTGELYDGFAAGRIAMSFNSSKSQPPVVDKRQAPIVDKQAIYSGCWGFVTVRPGWFKVQGNEGPTFYLQAVMVVEHDESLGGIGRADPKAAFGDISITSDVNPAENFGAAGPPAEDQPEDIFA
jgi:hypothetical protein